jgi:RNA polymerase sigma-70 factor (ECF subfamily)
VTIVEPSPTAAERRLAELEASFEAFCGENFVAVERFLLSQCGDRELVKEATQEAFLTALDKWEQIGAFEKPMAWMYKTARNKLRNRLARRRRHDTAPLDEVPTARLAAPPADPREAHDELLSWLQRLPSRHAAVFALHYDGWSDLEIARILCLADNTVRSYKAAARRRLQTLAREAGFAMPDRGR